MTTEDKFRAAVNVIRSLPKNGSYQPSYGLMLKFYAYFKQATEGACTEPQPGFWEVVKKKKWEAWMRLGNMSRNEAMESYVEELKKIIETMSYTDNVANFLESLGTFYESVPQEDLQLLVGDLMEKVNSRENSPKRAEPDTAKLNGVGTNGTTNGRPLVADTDSDADDEEEFIDSVEMDPDSQVDSPHSRPLVNGSLQNGTSHHGSNGTSQNSSGGEEMNGDDMRHGRNRSRARDRGPAVVKASLNGHAMPIPDDASCLAAQISLTSYAPKQTDATKLNNWGHMNGDAGSSKDVTDQLRATVKQLQRDLERVTTRVRSLEVATQPTESANSVRQKSIVPSWWPVPELSPRTTAFVVLWPLIVHGAAVWWRYRRNRRNP